MYYTLHQLKVFHTVAENQSITRAAEELSLTQPAVSIQLKKFQDQFSIPLTEVVSRKLYITDFGKEIAITAEKILNEVEAINYKTMAFQGQLSGRLKISVASTGKYVMPYFLSKFMHQHKGVDLIMDVTNKNKVVRSLEKNEIDFALVSVLPDHLQLSHIPLVANKLYLLGNASIPVSAKNKNRKILENSRLLFREPGSATRNAMETYLEKHDISSQKKIELTSNEALKQAVIAGLGISIMPIIGIKNALINGDLHIIPIKGLPIVTHWNLVWHKSKKLSPTALALIEYIEQNKEDIIKEHFDWSKDY